MPHNGSPAQKSASRENGKLGGRPRVDETTGELKRQRARARQEGREAAAENPLFWRQVRDDSRVPISTRMEAARELSDRYGDPKQQVIAMPGGISEDPPKLFDFGDYEAPASYSEHPPIANGGQTVQ